MNKKMKSIVVAVILTMATVIGLTACHNSCKHDEKCGKEMCCSNDCCQKCDGKESCNGKDCKEKCEKMCKEGKCCQKDSAMGHMGADKACCKKDSSAAPAKTGMYVCPMCKDVSSDKPGKCPHCGMDMKKK